MCVLSSSHCAQFWESLCNCIKRTDICWDSITGCILNLMSIDYSPPETNSQFGLLQVTTVWTILYCSSDALSLLERDVRYLYWRHQDLTGGLFTKLDFLLRLELKRDFVLIGILQFHCDIREGLLQQIASKHVRL
jgi:hypothetical protein